MPTTEHQLEDAFVQKLRSLKYEYSSENTDRAALEQNFRKKFEALNTHKKGLMQQLFPCPEANEG